MPTNIFLLMLRERILERTRGSRFLPYSCAVANQYHVSCPRQHHVPTFLHAPYKIPVEERVMLLHMSYPIAVTTQFQKLTG